MWEAFKYALKVRKLERLEAKRLKMREQRDILRDKQLAIQAQHEQLKAEIGSK